MEKILLKLKKVWYVLWKILKCFRLNSWRANPGESQFMILGDKTCYEHILKTNLTWVQSSFSKSTT